VKFLAHDVLKQMTGLVMGWSFGAPSILAITEMGLSSDFKLALTWNSNPGRIYSVSCSLDMIDWDADFDDGVVGDDSETTIKEFHLSAISALNGVPRVYFRVEQESRATDVTEIRINSLGAESSELTESESFGSPHPVIRRGNTVTAAASHILRKGGRNTADLSHPPGPMNIL
jgi:hypothetical protein